MGLIRRSRLLFWTVLVVFIFFLNRWKHAAQGKNDLQNSRQQREQERVTGLSPQEQVYQIPEFHPGVAKPSGSTYTKGVVVGHTSSENATWLEEADLPGVQKFIYSVDDRSAPLHTPMNKGNEAMIYLTYIIDHYNALSDITLFMHPHRYAWHTNELLNHDALDVIKRLSDEHVTREGYMNLRCHWDPGCPERIHPHNVKFDADLQEEHSMAEVWTKFFPGDPVPNALGTPCCAQFALSKERIHAIPRERYQFYREWLMHTSLSNWTSGRVFEYLWQKIFTGEPKHCPDMRICYCDGFGVCFPDAREFDYWFQLRHEYRQIEKELKAWKEKAAILNNIDRDDIEEKVIDIPEAGQDSAMQAELDAIFKDLQARRRKALQLGNDPQIRAKVAGRRWKEGDGF